MRLIALSLVIILLACSSNFETSSLFELPNTIEAGANEELAHGIVFHDENENNLKEESEKGISGVLVSNGVQIVQTDHDGKYSIPVSDDAILFVIKPRNWMTPVNDLNLPQFFTCINQMVIQKILDIQVLNLLVHYQRVLISPYLKKMGQANSKW